MCPSANVDLQATWWMFPSPKPLFVLIGCQLDVILQIAMRDPKAWGYDSATKTFLDEEKKDEMNESLCYVWNMLLPRVCGIAHWSVLKKCYYNISTGRPNPTPSNPHPEPFIQPSSEALLICMFENSWER